MIRCGLIGRAEETGLGRMSKDAVRNLPIADSIVVDVHHPQPMDLEPFGSAPVVDPKTPAYEKAVRNMLARIDTLLVLETPYDPRVYEWAREADVLTVCVAMPEYDIPDRWRADIVVNPTNYLHDRLPPGSLVFPWPVDLDYIVFRPREKAETYLHIVGQPCSQDRNGTQLVLRAFAAMPDLHLIVRSQEKVKQPVSAANIEYRIENVANVSDLYQEGDVLVYPRRYAGQSLPCMEAQAAGLPLICLDRDPERDWTMSTALIPAFVKNSWPVIRRSSRDVKAAHNPGYSPVDVYDALISDVIETVDRVKAPYIVESLSNYSRARAKKMSWEELGPSWLRILEGRCLQD